MKNNLIYVKRLENSKNGSFTKGCIYQGYKGQNSYKVKDNSGKWKFSPKYKFKEVTNKEA